METEVKVGRRIGLVLVCVAVTMVLGACGSSDNDGGGGLWALASVEVDADVDGTIDFTEMERTFKNGKLETQYQTPWSYTSYPEFTRNSSVHKSYSYRADGKLDEMVYEFSGDISDLEHQEEISIVQVDYSADGSPSQILTDQTTIYEITDNPSSGYAYTQTYTYSETSTQTPIYSQGKLTRVETETVPGDVTDPVSYTLSEYAYDSHDRCTGTIYSSDIDNNGVFEDVSTTTFKYNGAGLVYEEVEEYDAGNDGIVDSVTLETTVYNGIGFPITCTTKYDEDNDGTADIIIYASEYEKMALTFDQLRQPESQNSLFGESAPFWEDTQGMISNGYYPYAGQVSRWQSYNGTDYYQLRQTDFNGNGLPERVLMDYNNDGRADCIKYYRYVKI